MMLNIITFFIVMIFAFTYYEHTQHEHYEVVPAVYVVPEKSAELLEFIAECEEQGLIVTPIDNDTVSCTRG